MHHQSKERKMSKSQQKKKIIKIKKKKKKKKKLTRAIPFGLARFRFNEVRINEVPLYLRIKFISGCLSAPDVTSLHHRLKNKQPKLICFQW